MDATTPPGWQGHARDRRLVFLHVPKAAGTTVGSAVARWFLDEHVMPTPGPSTIPAHHPKLALAAYRYRLFGVGMHLDFDHVEGIRAALPANDRPFAFTLLREPRARLISQYLQWRRTPDRDLEAMPKMSRVAFLAARRLDLGPFLRSGLPAIERHFRDYQTGVLAGATVASTATPQQILERAIANAAALDLIGTTSNVDLTLHALASAFGKLSSSPAPFLKAAPEMPPPLLDDDAEAAIADFIALDMRLWQAVRAGTLVRSVDPPCRFVSVNRQLVTSLLGTGRTVHTMDMPLDGSGWHVREGKPPFARWTGPGRNSVIRLPAPCAKRLSVELQIVSELDPRVAEGLKLTLDSKPTLGPLVRGQRDGSSVLRGEFMLETPPQATCDLGLEVPLTLSHNDVLGDVGDARQKGIAIGAIELFVTNSVPPATLGDLFWPGEDWSSHAPAQIADVLDIRRDVLPIPAAARPLVLDLPMMFAVLQLIKPRHVFCLGAEAPLSGLVSCECPSASADRAVIVATLFEMSEWGGQAAAFVNLAKAGVLLMACAEDARLRSLLKHPVIAPHVHIIGGTNGILIANVAAMRRCGGDELVEAFFWLLARIASTTPERIGRHDDSLQRDFLERQLALTLVALRLWAKWNPIDHSTLALTATLVPELRPAPSLREATVGFRKLLAQGGTALELVSRSLVGELDSSLQRIDQHPPGHCPFDALLSAHGAAFRISHMLAGWQRFGLDENATVHLARELARSHAESIPQDSSSPLRIVLETVVDGVLGAAKGVTAALSDSEEVTGGIVRPMPLKPFGEYIDFYKSEARIIALRGANRNRAGRPLDGLRGTLDHVVRLNQAAREVEVALRLMGDRFPQGEIVWVDTGCSYGVVLTNVEPPTNVQGRCSFLGFDFNAAAIAEARAAAANMGRPHCRFEVGDVSDAKAVIGGARIHLITAFEVLEHCPDPLTVLKDYRALAPEMLVVGSPLSETQAVLPTEQHLWVWDAPGFTRLVEAAGFNPLGVNQRHVGRFVRGHDWVTVTAVTGNVQALAVV
jgi:hypothetical protein